MYIMLNNILFAQIAEYTRVTLQPLNNRTQMTRIIEVFNLMKILPKLKVFSTKNKIR